MSRKEYAVGKFRFSRTFLLRRPRLVGADGKKYVLSEPAFKRFTACLDHAYSRIGNMDDLDGVVNYLVIRAVGATRYPSSDMARAFFADPPSLTTAIFFELSKDARGELAGL